MNNHKSETQKQPRKGGGIGWKAVVRFALVLLLMPAALFFTAGRVDWWQAWVYVGLQLLATFVSRVIVSRKYPDLIKERAQYTSGEDVKSWDKTILPFIIYGPLVMLIVAALNVRFGWQPQIPLWLQLLGLVGVVLGAAFSTWAMLVNRFFSAVVRIQIDRGQSVISTGPYRVVRHPGYAGGVVACLVMPLLLGSVWALIPGGMVMVMYILRTALEDKTLQNELKGYKEYTARVRYRLLPGIW
jgi:protein-S-isoprenylcysteine O-methyltransferase Ste14